MTDSDLINRVRGSMLGLAAGDALGAALESRWPGTFSPVHSMIGGGPFGLAPGEWTDDTSMALCLAASLIESKGFDARDQMERYLLWLRSGYMSSTGRCFDIGLTVRTALAMFEQTGNPFSGPTHSHSAGNGSIMRLAPIAIYFYRQPAMAIERAADSSRTTHGAQEAVDACRYLAGLLVGALQGRPKEELLGFAFSPVPGSWEAEPLASRIQHISQGSYKHKEPPEIRGTGYVVESLEAALWAFHRSQDYRSGALLAINLGDDADTTGAVYGQLAGAHYGLSGIPPEWLRQLVGREKIQQLADGLAESGSEMSDS
jgi:ADP-ribosyl-[dinitrogen reductase] hydrolase